VGGMDGHRGGRMRGAEAGCAVGGGNGAHPMAKGTLAETVEQEVAVEVNVEIRFGEDGCATVVAQLAH
jgi:hypothetical protein